MKNYMDNGKELDELGHAPHSTDAPLQVFTNQVDDKKGSNPNLKKLRIKVYHPKMMIAFRNLPDEQL